MSTGSKQPPNSFLIYVFRAGIGIYYKVQTHCSQRGLVSCSISMRHRVRVWGSNSPVSSYCIWISHSDFPRLSEQLRVLLNGQRFQKVVQLLKETPRGWVEGRHGLVFSWRFQLEGRTGTGLTRSSCSACSSFTLSSSPALARSRLAASPVMVMISDCSSGAGTWMFT